MLTSLCPLSDAQMVALPDRILARLRLVMLRNSQYSSAVIGMLTLSRMEFRRLLFMIRLPRCTVRENVGLKSHNYTFIGLVHTNYVQISQITYDLLNIFRTPKL